MVKSQKGFTLVEILIVIAILGLVMTSIYSVYSSSQNAALGNEQVSDIQQSLRTGVDQIVRDVQMAGFLVSAAPLSVATKTRLEFTTVSTDLRISRIGASVTLGTGATDVTITLDDPMVSAKYQPGDYLRIFRPRSNVQPFDSAFTVKFVNPPDLTLVDFSSPADPVNFAAGDLVLVVASDATTYPKTVGYELQAVVGSTLGNLVRLDSADGDAVLSSGISGLEFEYVLDDGNVAPVSPVTSLTAAERQRVVAVRVALSGRVSDSLAGRVGQKNRTLQTVARIRNP